MLAAILGKQKRARLKELCRALGLDDGEKAVIIERLAGMAPPAAPRGRKPATGQATLDPGSRPTSPTKRKRGRPPASAARAAPGAEEPNSRMEARLWSAADELRANSKLKSSEYSVPVLGLIFLRYADHKFAAAEAALADKSTGRRRIGAANYQALGVLYLPAEARFSKLLRLPEGANVGQAINDAMRAIEAANRDLCLS